MKIFSRPMEAIMFIILQYFSQQARSVSMSYVNKENYDTTKWKYVLDTFLIAGLKTE